MTFDPDAPAAADAGLYGLPHTAEDAHVVVVPVPFEATVSFRTGTARGPEAILQASRQVDLFDGDVGRPYERGIAMEDVPAWLPPLADSARASASAAIDAQVEGRAPSDADLAVVEAAGERVNAHVQQRVGALLAAGKLPVVVGGDHSVPFGAIAACAAHLQGRPLGVLHLDAHCDLRDAYEGFRWSHASIMKNVLDRVPGVRLVQVGIRDFSDGELDAVRGSEGRVTTWFDVQLRRARLSGGFLRQAQAIAAALPDDVYLSFDIDGLEPALCPSTGTPVPGGLSWDEIVAVLAAVVAAGKRVVGLDLVEVAPPADSDGDALGDSWDANVGARLLYKMIGFALASRGECHPVALPVPPGLNG
ncbi:MAG: agmatinase family protein [Deltaproteobacteria bacterium]|nr:agmatinase family protein [Deltaproteobacteria bacterium]